MKLVLFIIINAVTLLALHVFRRLDELEESKKDEKETS